MNEETIKLKIVLAAAGGLIEDEDKERLAYNTDADLKKALGGWIHDTMEENCIQDAELEIIIKEYK